MTARPDRIVAMLLERHGRTYAGELGIPLARGTPAGLFRWLVASLLFSARINAGIALDACRALTAAGWTTPRKLADSTWAQRTRTLSESGYARYDERTASQLSELAATLMATYGGDLRRLREQAGRDPADEQRRLREFNGIGELGAAIFCREAQAAWHELYPFADPKALAAAAALNLPDDAARLAALVDRPDFPRLVAALVRADLAHDLDQVQRLA